jgi:hypothetical protein
MQYDMHYYATYAMAAAAGIPKADAEIIATSAQFVDDQNITEWVLTKSQEGILGVATAHHPFEAGIRTFFGTTESNDTRPVWVPFHFLPGAEGSTFQEKMVCRKNSKVVNQLLDYYLSDVTMNAHKEHALQLMGIAAHVYADTFSHYGFSGLSDETNQVEVESIRFDTGHSPSILDHIARQKDAFMASFTQAAMLGHGSVLTNPDRPYLKWSFLYKNGAKSQRSNPDTFLEACQALHARFMQFASLYYGKQSKPLVAWNDLEKPVKDILATEGSADERVRFWTNAMKEGRLGAVPVCRDYDSKNWIDEVETFRTSGSAAGFIQSNPYRFFVAADYHRNYVLKRLLPRFGLMVA